ncbi:MAG: septum formation initiator family protein [Candidatus Moraniibacteriota bacterium]
MKKKKRLTLLLLLLFLAVLVGASGYASFRQFQRNERIKSDIAVLQEQASLIRQENETLSEHVTYYSSQEYQEQEAKDKLDLRKAGETVLGVKESLQRPVESAGPAVENTDSPGGPPYLSEVVESLLLQSLTKRYVCVSHNLSEIFFGKARCLASHGRPPSGDFWPSSFCSLR